jgi:hypothetical protein
MSAVVPSAQARPRRKWGWIFIVAFVVQAVVFATVIGGLLSDSTAMTEVSQMYRKAAKDGAQEYQIDAHMRASKARQLRQEATLVLVLAVICSIGTLTGVYFGFRRRRQTASDRQPVGSG